MTVEGTGKRSALRKSRRSFKTFGGLFILPLNLSFSSAFVVWSSRSASEFSGMPLLACRLTTPGSAVMLQYSVIGPFKKKGVHRTEKKQVTH